MRHRTWAPNELLALVDNVPLRFEPGTDWWYSNTNYLLFGMLIERITGAPYAAEVHRRILHPLGMRHTTLPGTDPAIHGPHPHGYRDAGTGRRHRFQPSVAGSSGELVSTAADLNAFYRALLAGRLLRPAGRRELLVAQPTPRGYDYGLGLMTIVLPGGTRLWGHRGDFFGYHAQSWTTANGRRQLTIALTPWGPRPAEGRNRGAAQHRLRVGADACPASGPRAGRRQPSRGQRTLSLAERSPT